MKETIKINISGIIFHIDEDAYAKLREYLTEINSHFAGKEEGKEVIDDIESRIAELLQARVSEQKEVIDMSDIDEVIGIMGNPEDFFDADGMDEDTGTESRSYTGQRRLYRDPDNSVLGGVCGGLGNYFGIDPIWLRLAFVMLLLLRGFGLLVYLILWIVIPKARTRAQKLEMRGEAVTVSNIERTVKEEYGKVKDQVKNIPRSETYRHTRDGLTTAAHGFGQILVAILKAGLVIIGLAFLIAGITALVAFLGVMFYHHDWFPFYFWELPPFSFSQLLAFFIDPANVAVVQVCLLLTVGIPLLALIYGGIKLMFNIRTRDRVLGLTVFVLWLLSTLALVSFGVMEGRNYRTDNRVIEATALDIAPGDTLYIGLQSREDMGIDKNDIWIFDDEVTFLVNDHKFYIRPDLDILPSVSGNAEIETRKEARGYTREEAASNAERIEYHWKLEGNRLLLDPYFTPGANEKFRGQELDLKLRIPEGVVLYFERETNDILRSIDNDQDYWRYQLVGKYWTMGKEELMLNQ